MLQKAIRVLAALCILVLAVPFMPAQQAEAASAPWNDGWVAAAVEKAVVRYRNFGNNNGFDVRMGVAGFPSGQFVDYDSGSVYPWGATNAVTFSYDGVGTLTTTFPTNNGTGSGSRTYAIGSLSPADYLKVFIACRHAGTTVKLINITLNGSPLPDLVPPTCGSGTDVYNWHLTGVNLAAPFTLAATIELTGFTPTMGGQETSRVEFAVGKMPPPSAGISATDTTICVGEPTTINVNLANVSNLYGYELKVNYPPAGFTAAGAFVNTWFDTTTNANIPPGWNATDTGGVIKFAAGKVDPALPVSGSGTVAQVTLTATTAGVYDITLSDVLLGDRDGNPISAVVSPDKVTVEVCGFATVSGKVTLQGRGFGLTGTIPPTGGTVTLTDAGYGPFSGTFDATGTFTIPNVKVAPAGTNYTITAAHNVYLSNQTTTGLLMPLDVKVMADTRLKGGDADNSGGIGLADLTCIGGSFGSAPVVCGTTGSSDINADGLVNILDLVLPGGNYGLTSPQGW